MLLGAAWSSEQTSLLALQSEALVAVADNDRNGEDYRMVLTH